MTAGLHRALQRVDEEVGPARLQNVGTEIPEGDRN